MSRRTVAVLLSILMAPAGPLVLGDDRRVLISALMDLLGLAVSLAGAFFASGALFVVGVAFIVAVRGAMIWLSTKAPIAPNPPGIKRALFLLGSLTVIYIVLTQIARHDLVEAFKVPAGSMIPSLQVGDHMFVDKRATQPARGDVIVFKYPREPNLDFVKRVIGVGGDHIEQKGDELFINDKPITRKPVDGDCHYQDFDELTNRWEQRACIAFEEQLGTHTYRVYQSPRGSGYPPPKTEWTVPADSYFVIGDNRDNSHDSRFWGYVPADHVKGTARWIWWSKGPDNLRTERIGQNIP